MSDSIDTNDIAPLDMPDELSLLKQKAKLMGIVHSNNISLETLREKIKAKIDGSEPEVPVDPVPNPLVDSIESPIKRLTLRQHLINENMRLIRVRITNMNPSKKDLNGEILTVANEYIGTVRRFVPYGEQTENGWHLPYCIYQMMCDMQFVNIKVKKNKKDQEQIDTSLAKEFAIEVLPALTATEIRKIAAAQVAAGEE